jgi:hypothetical protein
VAVSIQGVLVGLLGELMGGQVVPLAVSRSCGGMGVRGKIVKFGDTVVRALGHGVSPAGFDAGCSGAGIRLGSVGE